MAPSSVWFNQLKLHASSSNSFTPDSWIMRLLSGRKWSPGSLQANMSSVVVDRERGFSTFRESLCARSTRKSRSPPAKSNATSSIGWSCGLSSAAMASTASSTAQTTEQLRPDGARCASAGHRREREKFSFQMRTGARKENERFYENVQDIKAR